MIILTINGKGNRFIKEGINTPKFLLVYKNKLIIEWIIENIKKGHNENQKLYIGLNHTYLKYKEKLQLICKRNNLDSEIFVLPDSNGQAHTVKMVLDNLNDIDESFWIFNCDTIVSSNWFVDEASEQDIIVEVFHSDSDNYSYIDDIGSVKNIAEKKVISNFASTGNYYFKSANLFNNLYNKNVFCDKDEIYISDIISNGIESSYSVSGMLIDNKKVCVLGTPEQYEQNT